MDWMDGMDHLVVRAAAAVDVAVAEPHRYIVDKLGDLEALEPAIAAVLWDQRFGLAVAGGLARPGRAGWSTAIRLAAGHRRGAAGYAEQLPAPSADGVGLAGTYGMPQYSRRKTILRTI